MYDDVSLLGCLMEVYGIPWGSYDDETDVGGCCWCCWMREIFRGKKITERISYIFVKFGECG